MTTSQTTACILPWLLLGSTVLAQERASLPVGTARISGRVVTADTGAPLAAVQIRLQADRLIDSSASYALRTATSDANGSFDFSGLSAGDYRLSTTKAGYLDRRSIPGPSTTGSLGHAVTVRDRQSVPVTIGMVRGGAITGRIVDAFGEPLAEVRVQAQRYSYSADGTRGASSDGVSDVTDDLGQFRVYGLSAGDFIVGAINASGNALGMSNMSLSADPRAETSPTYFPGTINVNDAQTVSLGPGQEASVHFMLVPARLRRVSGTVIAPAGVSTEGMTATLRSTTGAAALARVGARVSADGTFAIANVAPGDYRVDVTQPVNRDHLGGGGSVPVSISTDDVNGVTVVVTTGTTLRGEVVFEGVRPSGVFLVQARSDGTVGGPGSGLTGRGEVRADGRFEITGLFGRVYFEAVDEGWVVKSVQIDGVEVVDDPIDLVGTNSISDVRVIVTNRRTSVAGQVTDDRGRALKGHLAIILRTDRTSARPGLALRTVRSDEEGRFETRGMRPGSYVIGVVEDLEAGHQWSPDFQDCLRINGRRFSLDDGESVVLNLEPTSGLR